MEEQKRLTALEASFVEILNSEEFADEKEEIINFTRNQRRNRKIQKERDSEESEKIQTFSNEKGKAYGIVIII